MYINKYKFRTAPINYKGKIYSGNRILEHHLIYWLNTGIVINKEQVIHHRNGIKDDNRFENLELLERSQHSKDHGKEKAVFFTINCKNCKKLITLAGNDFRERRKNKMGIFCNRSCATKYQFSKY